MFPKPFPSPPALRNKAGGFTIIEVVVVILIMSFLISLFFYTMNAGQLSNTHSSARVDLQAEVRRTLEWVVKDARQTVSWDIANNSPTPDYIKFRQVTGWDTVNSTFLLSDTYIEYTYDANASTITRRTSDAAGNTIGTWLMNYVVASPFFTLDSSGSIVPLNQNDLLTSKQLIITISGQKQVQGSENTTYSLTEEVQIRNG